MCHVLKNDRIPVGRQFLSSMKSAAYLMSLDENERILKWYLYVHYILLRFVNIIVLECLTIWVLLETIKSQMVTFQLWVVCRSVPLFSRIFYYLCHSNIGLRFHRRKVKEKMITHREVQLLCKEIPLEQNSLKRSLPHNFHCV